MKKRFGVWTLAWVLFGLLMLAGVMFLLGAREFSSDPSTSSYGPSGTRAFVELLNQAGYRCQVRRDARPRLAKDELVLGFVIDRSFNYGLEPQPASDAEKAVRAHVAEGGRAYVLEVPEDFSLATATATLGARMAVFDEGLLPPETPKSMELTKGHELSPTVGDTLVEPSDPKVVLASGLANEPLFELHGGGKGMLAVLRDATGATNRFLDERQNAEFLLWTLETINPEKATIVIVEALHGEAVEPGLLGLIGGWATAGWWQLVLVLVVIGYSFGRRFGLPEVDRTVQRSGRELVDAYADTMNRSGKAQVALARIAAEADRQVRRRFNLPHDLPVSRRNEVLPAPLAAALTRAELASKQTLTDGAATLLAFELEDALAGLGRTEKRRRRRRR